MQALSHTFLVILKVYLNITLIRNTNNMPFIELATSNYSCYLKFFQLTTFTSEENAKNILFVEDIEFCISSCFIVENLNHCTDINLIKKKSAFWHVNKN